MSGEGLKIPQIIILASSSVNRIKLLKQIGIDPIIVKPECEENLSKTLSPENYAVETANIKIKWVYNKLVQEKKYFDVIIACDTIISMNDEIIGKPKDLEDARETLNKLNGKIHEVITGVVIKKKEGEIDKFYTRSKVKFRNNKTCVLEDYINTGEPLGHAGSYAIQKKGAILIESIEGCYNNIVGLPLAEVYDKIRDQKL
uniref:Nucleotide PPase n=1 Tax=Parastrongyloides trichosuri TaxID=131310 RepID=A0A0N4Z773_PARTI